VCETHKDIERIVMIARLKTMKRAAKIAIDFGIDARVSFDAVRHPIGSPGVFDQVDQAKDVFMFARAAELNAEDVDFDKLIAREKALSDDSSSEEDGSNRNASRAT
jgi:hypothetical protein